MQVRGLRPGGYQNNTGRDKDAAARADAAADAVTPSILPHGGAAAAVSRVEPPQAPSTARSPALGARELLAGGLQGVAGRMPGL